MNHRQKAEELVSDFSNQDTRTILTERISRALKETEKDTWARAEKAIQACDPMARGESLIFQTLLSALREEAGKEGVEV